MAYIDNSSKRCYQSNLCQFNPKKRAKAVTSDFWKVFFGCFCSIECKAEVERCVKTSHTQKRGTERREKKEGFRERNSII